MLQNLPLVFGLVFSPWQLLIVLVVVLLMFGNRLPELMRSLGRSVTEFKKGINEAGDEDETAKKIEKS